MRRSGLWLAVATLWAVCIFLPPAANAAYEEGTVAGGGKITGTVTYNGTVPMRKIIPTKDQEVCGGVRDEPQVILGDGKKVVDAVVYLKDLTKGKKWEKPKKTPELVNHGCQFVPHVQVVPLGMKLAIVNSDPVLHNTHGFLIKTTLFNVAMPTQGQRVEKPLSRPGVVRVECDAHGWMLAWIYVADSPYVMQTGKDGAFTLSDVPPGNYTLVVWQEKTGAKEIPVAVKAGETVALGSVEIK
ncbi:MAG: hypothetical protein M0009_08005 [Deltaproteobacteria bacterium]|nr:hypothetical protein [Deltaproteobacteria bacterium]